MSFRNFVIYQSKQIFSITQFASKAVKPVTLKQLVRFGQPPLSNESLQACTHYARTELPVRLARRVRAFQSLPFIVGTNPYIKEVYSLYYDSFESLVKYALPETDATSISVDDDVEFTEKLKDFVERHSDNIPTLARGKIFLCLKCFIIACQLTHNH